MTSIVERQIEPEQRPLPVELLELDIRLQASHFGRSKNGAFAPNPAIQMLDLVDALLPRVRHGVGMAGQQEILRDAHAIIRIGLAQHGRVSPVVFLDRAHRVRQNSSSSCTSPSSTRCASSIS